MLRAAILRPESLRARPARARGPSDTAPRLVENVRSSSFQSGGPVRHYGQGWRGRRAGDDGSKKEALPVGSDVVFEQVVGGRWAQVRFEQRLGRSGFKGGFGSWPIPGPAGDPPLTATAIIIPSAPTKNSSLPSPRQRGWSPPASEIFH